MKLFSKWCARLAILRWAQAIRFAKYRVARRQSDHALEARLRRRLFRRPQRAALRHETATT